ALALYRIVRGGAHADEQALERPDTHLQSSMYVPLCSEGRVIGLTYLAAFRPDAFSPEDERVLSELASHASGAYRRLEGAVHRLRLSPRQSQVLALIASGLSDKEVASRLGLAHRPCARMSTACSASMGCAAGPRPSPPGCAASKADRAQGRHSARPFSLSNRQTFSGVTGMSTCRTPTCASASTTAFTIAGGAPTVADSPTPLAPKGWCGDGVTVLPVSQLGV